MIHRLLAFLREPGRLRRIGRVWVIGAAIAIIAHSWSGLRVGLTDGYGRPFGDDTLNFWAAAVLAVEGQASAAYDMPAFHRFQLAAVGADLNYYHSGYPPMLMLLTAPLGVLPYLWFWPVWHLGGWLLFALCVRRLLPRDWLLYAAALPAVMLNPISGQIGCWTASILGWGLTLLPGRPAAAGAVLSLAILKPQLAWLVPLALLAAQSWRALAGFACGCAALFAATTAAFGGDIWPAYAQQAQVLREVILENGTGVWHRMFSVFVLVRHLGTSTATAYAAQAIASVSVAAVVLWVWRSNAPQAMKNAALVLGTILAAPYVSDYDLVVVGLVPLWLLQSSEGSKPGDAALWLASALVVIAPMAVAPLAVTTGVAGAGVLLLPALWLAAASSRPSPGRDASTRGPTVSRYHTGNH